MEDACILLTFVSHVSCLYVYALQEGGAIIPCNVFTCSENSFPMVVVLASLTVSVHSSQKRVGRFLCRSLSMARVGVRLGSTRPCKMQLLYCSILHSKTNAIFHPFIMSLDFVAINQISHQGNLLSDEAMMHSTFWAIGGAKYLQLPGVRV